MSNKQTYEWLNYHHLFYFWVVVREGGLIHAARKLRVTHSTVAAQVRALEERLGEPLLERQGRRVAATEVGRVVFRYADEIFGLGRELVDAVAGRAQGQGSVLAVGIIDALPKLVSRELLTIALQLPGTRVVCHEDRLDRLLGALASHELDVVLADAPVLPSSPVRAFGHLIGQSEVSFFAAPDLAAKLRRGFPASLDGAPVVLPTLGTSLRASLERWFAAQRLRPRVVAEVEDSALLKSLGQVGAGLFAAPRVVRKEIIAGYRVKEVGLARGVVEQFYAITATRKFEHPALAAITSEAARRFAR